MLSTLGRDIRDVVGSSPIMSMQLKQEGLNVLSVPAMGDEYTLGELEKAQRQSSDDRGRQWSRWWGRGMVGC